MLVENLVVYRIYNLDETTLPTVINRQELLASFRRRSPQLQIFVESTFSVRVSPQCLPSVSTSTSSSRIQYHNKLLRSPSITMIKIIQLLQAIISFSNITMVTGIYRYAGTEPGKMLLNLYSEKLSKSRWVINFGLLGFSDSPECQMRNYEEFLPRRRLTVAFDKCVLRRILERSQ